MISVPRQPAAATRLTLVAVWLPWAGGCISGSLASDTDRHPLGYRFSDKSWQMVHIGETVDFDFVLQDMFRHLVPPAGLADYCAATIGRERIETESDLAGHFRFTHTFDRASPEDRIHARATAFRQRGRRDFMMVGGRWLANESPFDEPDGRVASDSITFTIYEAPIELTIVRPPDDLDPESGVLRIRRADGTTTSVYIDRPHRPGFTLTDPGPDGYYRVRYRPSGNTLNPTGTTEVDFVIHDIVGHSHHSSAVLETP